MTVIPRIGFIGFGSMAQALMTAFNASRGLQKNSISFTRRNSIEGKKQAANFGISFVHESDILAQSDILILCVKPHQLPECRELLSQLSTTHALISLLAGIPHKTLSAYSPKGTKIIRAMPNTPSKLSHGMTALCPNTHVDPSEMSLIHDLFGLAGKTLQLQESQMDIATALCGSMPAYFYKIVDILAESGCHHGLTREESLLLITQTLIGSGHLLQESPRDPRDLIREVASPGGTTEAGLQTLSHSQLKKSLCDIIDSTVLKAQEIRKKNS